MKTLEELRAEMSGRSLSGHFAALAPFAKNAVRIALDECGDGRYSCRQLQIWRMPGSAPDTEWFRTELVDVLMSFLAQVNLAECVPFSWESP